MRVLLFLGLSLVLLCSVVFADHVKGHGNNSGDKDDHAEKGHGHDHHHHGHDHHHHDHGHHKHHHHRDNETLACHKLADSNSKFAFGLFKQMAIDNPSQNILFSPLSISLAMSYMSLGAKGKTHDQMIEGIGFNMSKTPKEDIHKGFHHLLDMMDDNDQVHVNSGNALFLSNLMKIQDDFLQSGKDLYHSEAFTTDFTKTEEAKKQINSYVEKKTNGKIVDVLSSVSEDAGMVLVNFMYFNGQWEKPFEEQFTKEGDFHVSKDKVVKVPFLHRTGGYQVGDVEGATMVSIPYKGNTSALFILPHEGKMEEVESNLQDVMKNGKKSSYREVVDLAIPKFAVAAIFDLKEVLSKFGMVEMFSDTADFSGITGSPNLKISKALHKATMNVDEKGTEAAAATVMEAIPMRLPRPLILNRPFLVSIFNSKTNSVLFMGKVVNPKE